MFVLSKGASYSWPVNVSVPVSGGKFEKKVFDITFKRVSQSRLQEILGAEDLKNISDASFCKEIVMGWKGIVDESGAEVPFSIENLEALLDVPMVAKSIVTTYLETIAGQAKSKN